MRLIYTIQKRFFWIFSILMGIALGTSHAQTPFKVKNQCMLNPECEDDVTMFSDTLETSVAWQWNFGDGASQDNTATTRNAGHAYQSPGTYNVKLVRTLKSGGIDSLTMPIQVGELPPSFQNWKTDTTICPGQTITLVTAATILAIVIGIGLGIITALRQYSALDYTVTFAAFLFFSLPIFWMAVLLKEFGAIGFNDFLRDPHFSPAALATTGVVMGLVVAMFLRGSRVKRMLGFAVGAVGIVALLMLMEATGWFTNPGLGPIVILVTGVGIAAAITQLTAGVRNRRALYSALIMAPLGVVAYYVLNPLFSSFGTGHMIVLAVVTILVGCLVGWLMGGYDRGQSMRAAALSGFLIAGLVLLDRFMIEWPYYVDNSRINGRPIATFGSATPNLEGDWWTHSIDTFTHLLLPTIALMLVSMATYSRYSRASMLEIMEQDYIRTARAKGLPERTVVMRHAFRNALIPLATVVAFDVGVLIGGAVITERVFAFTGMGNLFVASLSPVPDPNPIMGVFLVVGIVAMVFNLLADLAYSVLDPRVRVKA